MHTELELQHTLAKMLPKAIFSDDGKIFKWIKDGDTSFTFGEVKKTEWLHVCWLIEKTLGENGLYRYYALLKENCSATWQQRTYELSLLKCVPILTIE